MSREIKFRAWNKLEKKMLYSDDDKFLCEPHAFFGSICPADDSAYYCKGRISDINRKRVYKYSKPMQYTGLEDKNGKEIYEGDILKDQRGQFGVVFYSNNLAAYQVNWKMDDGSYMTDSCLDYGKVVGNKYENKELLKEDNE